MKDVPVSGDNTNLASCNSSFATFFYAILISFFFLLKILVWRVYEKTSGLFLMNMWR